MTETWHAPALPVITHHVVIVMRRGRWTQAGVLRLARDKGRPSGPSWGEIFIKHFGN